VGDPPSSDLTAFACKLLGTKLARDSCGKRHAVGKDATCAGCEIGKAHKRGEEPSRWPDGSPIVELRWRSGVGYFTVIRPRVRVG
jgi:hypothetical protein